MATSQKTIDQVKNILGKLDRHIDALRERRLGDGPRQAFAGIGGAAIGQSILPAAQPAGFANQPDFGIDALTVIANNTTLTAGAGYGYLWMKNEFFVTGSLLLGPGYRRTAYQLSTGESKTDTSVGLNVLTRLALGLNGRKGLLTLGAYVDQFNYQTQSFTITNSIYGATIAFALRF